MLIIRFTIILVAFDLEEFGSQGALVFLHDFLFPKVQRLLPLQYLVSAQHHADA